MARIFLDSFCTGDGSAWDYSKASSYNADRPGFGPYCARKYSSAEYHRKTLGAQYTDLYFKFRMEFNLVSTASYPFFVFRANNAAIAHLRVNKDTYVLEFSTHNTESSAGTLRASSVVAIAINRVYLIEGFIRPLDSGSGRFTLKLNSTTVIDWTGISTYGTEYVDAITVGNDVGAYPELYYGDIVLDSADWIGPSRIGCRVPTGAGNYAQFTPSAGANWQCVDEVPVNTTDFNHVNTVDQIDSFTTGAIQVGAGGFGVASIKSYAVTTNVRKTGSPTPAHIRQLIRSGSTDDVKGSYTPGEFALACQSIWETDPATGAAWAVSAAPEIGYKSQT